jgi:hypothetical protein
MAVKWIGQVADELGMSVYTAIELLASQQCYPMSGLLDEDRVILLKRFREGRLADESASHARPAFVSPAAPAPAAALEDEPSQPLTTAPIVPPPMPAGSSTGPVVAPPPLPFRGMSPHDETTGPTTAFRTDAVEERTVIIQPIHER